MGKLKLWLKARWYWAVFATVVVVGFVVLRSKPSLYKQLLDKYRDLIEKNKRDLEELSKVREEEHKELNKNKKDYDEKLSKIEKDHGVLLDAIEQEKKDKIKEIINRTADDPNKMAKEINEFFGVRVLEEEGEK